MTEPEALDLLASIKRTTTIGEAIEAIQRAFEEQTRELREALDAIAAQDDIELILDPHWAKRIARQALATRQDAPEGHPNDH